MKNNIDTNEQFKQIKKLMLESEGSPEENDFIDGVREILKKQKKNKDENAYYDDFQHLFEKFDISFH